MKKEGSKNEHLPETSRRDEDLLPSGGDPHLAGGSGRRESVALNIVENPLKVG